MKNLYRYGNLFLWLSVFCLISANLVSKYYDDALVIGIPVAFIFTIVALIIYIVAWKKDKRDST
jgi:hypothetical protein